MVAAAALVVAPCAAQSAGQGTAQALPQGATQSGPAGAATTQAGASAVYSIVSVDFAITGRPLAYVLRDLLDIPTGKSFPDKASLEAYLADRRQVLVNQRALQSAAVSYDLGQQENGKIPVLVHFQVKESWNLFALPEPLYSTSTGFDLSFKGRDYDFAGSLQTLMLNFDYTYDQYDRQGLGGLASFSVPFLLGPYEASVGANTSLTAYSDGRPTNSSSTLSFSLTDRRRGFPLTLSFSQGLTTNPDAVSTDIDPYYLTDTASYGSSFTFFDDARGIGPLVYSPSVSLSQMWRFEAPVRSDRQGPVTTFSHSLTWGRVDWVGEMEKGVQLSISNSEGLDWWGFSTSIALDSSAAYYRPLVGPFAFKTRLQLFDQVTGAQRTNIGSNMRGIIDGRINGVEGAFLNVDLPIKLFDFPTHYIFPTNLLDFQAQIDPFIDAGEVLPNYGDHYSSQTGWLSCGLEGYAFPFRARSFIIRASLGFDVLNYLRTQSLTAETQDGYKPYEISFGVGLLY